MSEHSKEEAEAILEKMQMASSTFYAAAVKIGCHAFIEFTGLMNEYINVCRSMTEKGDLSWVMANTHTEVPLDMRAHHVHYLLEKLDCIYGPTLKNKLKDLYRNPSLDEALNSGDGSYKP